MHETEKWKWSHLVVSDSSRPHGLQPTRLLHPWDFPGKSTGVGCHCLLRTSMFQIQRKSHFLKPFKKRQHCGVKNPNQIGSLLRLPWKRWPEEPHYFYGLDLIPHKTFLCDFSIQSLKHPKREMKSFRLVFKLDPKAYMFISLINPMHRKHSWVRFRGCKEG